MKYLFIVLLGSLFVSCSGPRVLDLATAPDANFGNYKTFAFYEVTAFGDTITEQFNERIAYLKKGIAAQMEQRRFTQVPKNPDLFINIGVAIKLEVQTRETSWPQDGMMRYMGQRNYKWKSEEVEVGRYRRGAISLHVVDAAKNHMLWTATLRGSLPDDSTKLKTFADKGIQALFSKFPVQ